MMVLFQDIELLKQQVQMDKQQEKERHNGR